MKTRRYIKWFSSLFFDDCLIEEKKGCKLTIVAKLTSACIPDTPLNIERRFAYELTQRKNLTTETNRKEVTNK